MFIFQRRLFARYAHNFWFAMAVPASQPHIHHQKLKAMVLLLLLGLGNIRSPLKSFYHKSKQICRSTELWELCELYSAGKCNGQKTALIKLFFSISTKRLKKLKVDPAVSQIVGNKIFLNFFFQIFTAFYSFAQFLREMFQFSTLSAAGYLNNNFSNYFSIFFYDQERFQICAEPLARYACDISIFSYFFIFRHVFLASKYYIGIVLYILLLLFLVFLVFFYRKYISIKVSFPYLSLFNLWSFFSLGSSFFSVLADCSCLYGFQRRIILKNHL